MSGRAKGQPAALPALIRILPLGKVELSDSREPFEVDAASLAAMVTAFRSRGWTWSSTTSISPCRASVAPAAGWIKDLEARPDGLWARVEWTRQARGYSAQQGVSLLFPGFASEPDDPDRWP